ncbi:MAG: hypothetical protein RI911_581 [Candidatus Parcubacteria bacterium]|jgi:hypothetical protein
MNEEQYELLKKTYTLASENNRMLHASRRNAFVGSIIKIGIYAALVIVPLWYVMPYLQATMSALNTAQQKMQEVQGAVNKIQGATNSVGNQFQEVNKMIGDFQKVIPGTR